MDDLPPPPAPADTTPPPAEVELLLKYLADHDATCPVCQYNLRHLTAPRCPECGHDIKLTIGTTDPYLLPWILTLVAATLPAGVGMLLIVDITPYLRAILADFPRMHASDLFGCFSACYCVVSIPLAIFLIQSRRKFWRLSVSTQRIWAGILLAIDFALLVVEFMR